jgi:hypothetical protein
MSFTRLTLNVFQLSRWLHTNQIFVVGAEYVLLKLADEKILRSVRPKKS